MIRNVFLLISFPVKFQGCKVRFQTRDFFCFIRRLWALLLGLLILACNCNQSWIIKKSSSGSKWLPVVITNQNQQSYSLLAPSAFFYSLQLCFPHFLFSLSTGHLPLAAWPPCRASELGSYRGLLLAGYLLLQAFCPCIWVLSYLLPRTCHIKNVSCWRKHQVANWID